MSDQPASDNPHDLTNPHNLTWHEKDILGFFMEVSVGPNQMIDVQRLWQEWGQRGTNVDFSDAIMGLIAKGLLYADRSETACAMTNEGFAVASSKACS